MSRRASTPLAAVRIGIDDFILPMADALKLVEIMGRARPAERRYDAGKRWIIKGADVLNDVELTLVHERDITASPAPAPRLLALPAPGRRP